MLSCVLQCFINMCLSLLLSFQVIFRVQSLLKIKHTVFIYSCGSTEAIEMAWVIKSQLLISTHLFPQSSFMSANKCLHSFLMLLTLSSQIILGFWTNLIFSRKISPHIFLILTLHAIILINKVHIKYHWKGICLQNINISGKLDIFLIFCYVKE